MKVHAVRLGTLLILHKMGAIFSGTKGGFQGPPIYMDVINGLDCSQGVLCPLVSNVG